MTRDKTSIYHMQKKLVEENTTLRLAINRSCEIIERADARNLANDGPAGGFVPQMTLAEWRTLFVTLDKARQFHVQL